VFVMVEVNKAWYESLPEDLRKIVDADAASEQIAIAPVAGDIVEKARKGWTAGGGELIDLPADEQARLMTTFSTAVAGVAKTRPAVDAAYKIVSAAAQRTRQ
jgi:TRAP-type C4-dicarboxylate transport system substrate-binding protein